MIGIEPFMLNHYLQGADMFMKTIIIIFSAITTFATIGCASSRQLWSQDGFSHEQSVTALSECKYQIGLKQIPETQQEELLKHCMQGKGYRLNDY